MVNVFQNVKDIMIITIYYYLKKIKIKVFQYVLVRILHHKYI
jgi:hypothetical protein